MQKILNVPVSNLISKYTLKYPGQYNEPKKRDMAVCICYFSYCRYNKPLINLQFVINDLKRVGIPVYVIELLYPGQTSIIDDVYKVVRSNSVLFHKENLLNILGSELCNKYDKLLFLDGDIRFINPDWYTASSIALDQHNIIQPMKYVVWLDEKNNIIKSKCSFAEAFTKKSSKYHPGFSVGMTSDLFKKLRGFYDLAVFGAGDTLFFHAVQKSLNIKPKTSRHVRHIIKVCKTKNFNNYINNMKNQHISVGCVQIDNIAAHLPHGQSKNRKYSGRYYEFDMAKSRIWLNNDGVYECDSKTNEYMQTYFIGRREDDK